MDLLSLQAEKQWRNSRRKMIKDAVKAAGNRNLTEPEIQKELRQRRRKEREELLGKKQSLLQVAMESTERFRNNNARKKGKSKLYSTIVPQSKKYCR
jgi:hypothetical protein